jgi:hypothetical protein
VLVITEPDTESFTCSGIVPEMPFAIQVERPAKLAHEVEPRTSPTDRDARGRVLDAHLSNTRQRYDDGPAAAPQTVQPPGNDDEPRILDTEVIPGRHHFLTARLLKSQGLSCRRIETEAAARNCNARAHGAPRSANRSRTARRRS